MPKMKPSSTASTNARRGRPATTPEARELQLISLAMDRAEEQLLDGTASAQVITHFLKLGTARAELEKEKLKKENQLMEAKTKAIESAEEMKKIAEEAIKAMRNYQGLGDFDEY